MGMCRASIHWAFSFLVVPSGRDFVNLYFPRNYPFTYPNHLPRMQPFSLSLHMQLPISFLYHPLFYPSAHPPLPKYQIPACKRYIYTIRRTLHVLFYLWLPCLFHSCSPIAISLSLGPKKYIRLALCSFEARIWALDLARAHSVSGSAPHHGSERIEAFETFKVEKSIPGPDGHWPFSDSLTLIGWLQRTDTLGV